MCLICYTQITSLHILIELEIYFWQSVDDLKSMAVEAVLLLQAKINDEDDDTVTIRLLVPSKIIGCIIGKSGSIINEIRKRTRADVRISKSERPKCADANDELVEVSLMHILFGLHLSLLICISLCMSCFFIFVFFYVKGGWRSW